MEERILPPPFDNDIFSLYQEGIWDDNKINVYINNTKDFAYLNPQPIKDYTHYTPRVEQLKLADYKSKNDVFQRRFDKIAQILNNGYNSLVEIGAGNGEFLKLVRQMKPHLRLTSIEPDERSLENRLKISDIENYNDIYSRELDKSKFDIICFFHVFEHILEPASFINRIKNLMHNDSIIIVEVPSLFDPLITIYNCQKYKEFYFQSQHAIVYSHNSLKRIFEYNGFKTLSLINYQRYGLENHLGWLIHGRPGGDPVSKKILKQTNKQYIYEIETSGKTDSVIYVGKL